MPEGISALQEGGNVFLAAEGVITSYETRSTFISGRVKQAKSPEISRQ